MLPAGRYRIIAMAEYYRETPGQNGFRELCGDQHELAAEVVVDVVEPASSAAPSAPPTLAPSVTPVSAAPEVVLDANLRALVVGGSSGP